MLIIVLASSLASARAASLTWDTDGVSGGATGGAGAWNTAGNFWDNSGVMTTWNNATPDSAIFGGTAGLVTLGANIIADSVTFNTAGYTLDLGANRLANNTFAGSGALTLLGNGGSNVLASGVSSYSGSLTLAGGLLEIANGATLPNGSGITIQGVRAGAGTLGGSSYPFLSVTRNGTLYLRDDSGAPGAKQIGSQILTLNNGSVLWSSGTGAATTTIDTVALSGGFNSLAVAPNGAPDVLVISNLTRSGSATVEFRASSNILGSDVKFVVTNINGSAIANVNAILGGWAFAASASSAATYGSPARSFAAWNASAGTLTNAFPDKANGSTAGTATTVAAALSTGTATENWLANSSQDVQRTITSGVTINSLIEEADVKINSGATLTLNSGGLIFRNNSFWMQTTSGGTGFLTSGTNDLYLQADGGGGDQFIKVIIKDGPAGAVALRKSGSGLVKLEQNHTYTGGTFVNQGTLDLQTGGGTACIRGSANINPGAIIYLTSVNAFGYTSASVSVTNVSINGGTLNNGSGGDNGYYTTFNLTGGTMTGGGYWIFGSAANSAINSLASPVLSTIGGNIYLKGDLVNLPITTALGMTPNGIDLDISAAISGDGGKGIVKSGPGALRISGANTYSGLTIVNGGRMEVTGTLRNSTNFNVLSNATLKLDGVNIFTSDHGTLMQNARVITADAATLLMDTNFESRFANVTLKNGATWTCNRGLNSWDALMANTGLGAATVLVTNTSGTVPSTMNGVGGIHLQGVQNFEVADVTGDSSADLLVSMVLSGSGAQGGSAGGINKNGTGTMTLTSPNTYNGNTTISAGTLTLSGNGSISNSPLITLNSTGAILDVSTIAFTLSANQTLSGVGSVTGVVNVASGGTIAAGTNSYGNLSLSSLTLNNGASINVRPSSASVIVSDSNSLTTSGGANSVIINLGTNSIPTGIYTLIDYSGSIQGGGFNAFQLGSTPGSSFGYLLVNNTANSSVDLEVFTNVPPAISGSPSPADGAAGVTNYPVLNVNVTDPNPGNLTVTFYGRVAPPTEAVDFTLVALPDTQYYTAGLYGGTPAIFTNQTQWIINNRTNRNITYVTQLGDCVEHGDNGGNNSEWRNATNALYRLEDPVATQFPPFGIPYGVAVGNHDNSTDSSGVGTTTFYNQYFGESHFQPYNYYGGHFGTNNDNHFDLFSAGGMDFVVLYFEYDETATNTNAPVYIWANNVLATNANRRAIVVSHWILNDGGSFGPQGQTIYNALKGNSNLFLMLCGHINTGTGEALRSDIFNGRIVWSALSDYQQRSPSGGNGLLRLYEFSPANNVIHVKTYSPWLNQSETDADSQFDIPVAMTASYGVLGTITDVTPGNNASLPWAGLVTNTTYEWYVTINDGQVTTTSPQWRFTTDSTGGPIRPLVSLTRPANGEVFTNPPAITIEAAAADPDGGVTNVAFYQGTTKLEDDSSAPYSFAWTGVAAGSYAIRAVATDNSGLSTTSFVANITVVAPTTVTRGPYLQNGSDTAVTVRWRTAVATDARVTFGTNLANLNVSVSDATLTTEHEIRLDGLSSDTQYFYTVGTMNMPITAADTNVYVITAPLPGTRKPTRIWVLGDAGTAGRNTAGDIASQASVRDSYYNFTGNRRTDLWLMLGDNAYENGTDAQFQLAVFNMYPTLLRNSVLWPALGNHETDQSTNPNSNYPYFDMFTLPKSGEAGGLASGTEHYYSFNYGNIHFICLDSMTVSRAANGAMAMWLTNDLANTTAEWIIAYWHHPPYTKGSHDSDSASDSSGSMVEMRQNILPLLEAGGVDLVLSGHSHSYERSYLLDGHYGSSGTLTPVMKLDSGSGRTNGTGAYVKLAGGAKISHKGAVYVVAGSSGQTSGGSLNHPAMYLSLNNLGSVVLDINSNRLDAKFVRETGAVDDYFTILKSNAPPVAASLVFNLKADSATNLTLTANDPNGDPLTYVMNSQPTRGLVSGFNPTSGAFTYIPAHGFTGADSFTFSANDGQTNSAAAPAGLNVAGLVDANFNGIPDAWESLYGISNANADDDGDGMSNLQEYFANTNPTNSSSAIRITSVSVNGDGHATISWQSTGGTRYRVTYAEGDAASPFTDIVRPVNQEMDPSTIGNVSNQSYTDDLPASLSGNRYFRIKVIQ
jgi:autotransporter-associated beta strand protein